MRQLCGCTIVSAKPSAKVITIKPAANTMCMERVVKLFTKDF